MLLALLLSTALGHHIAHRAQAAAGSAGSHLDCSSFVRRVYAHEGVWLPRDVREIHSMAAELHALRSWPRVGDLVFFRHTTDEPGFTHIGIVTRVRGAVVTFVHRSHSGVVRSQMDLRHPK